MKSSFKIGKPNKYICICKNEIVSNGYIYNYDNK